MTEDKLNPKTPYQDLTIGGNIYTAGNAKEFKTGDWRSQKPIWIPEKCKQCGLCWPVCPDDAIPVTKDKKRTDGGTDCPIRIYCYRFRTGSTGSGMQSD